MTCLASHHRPPEIRVLALEVLAQIVHESDNSSMVSALVRTLVEANSDVRQAALCILRNLTSTEAEESILSALLRFVDPFDIDALPSQETCFVIDSLGSRER